MNKLAGQLNKVKTNDLHIIISDGKRILITLS